MSVRLRVDVLTTAAAWHERVMASACKYMGRATSWLLHYYDGNLGVKEKSGILCNI